ncbi:MULTISPECIES: hypothetical protein [spotted fever group]|uniref:Uncharacterized protein n=1 Tax=Rickettsia rhipicephali str. Ect TaxID=1359199 RepID=A0A0F3PGC3_RICRH|nr:MULTISPECIES: hypothetical protein [spotted fever group]KJV79323.1 hypothetical protein RMAECT_1591 [Rickettsia rhipicephali str. Ect]
MAKIKADGKNYITKNKIRSYAYLDLFDPFLFYSGYSFIMNTNLNDIPMIELGPVKYLPATRAIDTCSIRFRAWFS